MQDLGDKRNLASRAYLVSTTPLARKTSNAKAVTSFDTASAPPNSVAALFIDDRNWKKRPRRPSRRIGGQVSAHRSALPRVRDLLREPLALACDLAHRKVETLSGLCDGAVEILIDHLASGLGRYDSVAAVSGARTGATQCCAIGAQSRGSHGLGLQSLQGLLGVAVSWGHSGREQSDKEAGAALAGDSASSTGTRAASRPEAPGLATSSAAFASASRWARSDFARSSYNFLSSSDISAQMRLLSAFAARSFARHFMDRHTSLCTRCLPAIAPPQPSLRRPLDKEPR